MKIYVTGVYQNMSLISEYDQLNSRSTTYNNDHVRRRWANKVRYYIKNMHYISNDNMKIHKKVNMMTAIWTTIIWQHNLNIYDLKLIHRNMFY